jgi:nitroreductase
MPTGRSGKMRTSFSSGSQTTAVVEIAMDLYKAIKQRRTVRDFLPKPIPKSTLSRILAAGLRAPTNDHLRQWEFVVLAGTTARYSAIDSISKNLTVRQAESFLNKAKMTDAYQRAMYIEAIPKQYRMLLDAGTLIIPCFKQKQPLLKPKSLSSLNAFASMWCCIENMLLAATAEGIYGVTRIPFDKEIGNLHQTLGIPADYAIPCYLALGYPDKDRKKIKQHIANPRDRMHINRW